MYSLLNRQSDLDFKLLKRFVKTASKTVLSHECTQSADNFKNLFDSKDKSLGMRSFKSKHDLSVNKDELINSLQKIKLCNYEFD